MNRRSFLAALACAKASAAPLIARPTLEDIERLTWRRKFFPGWTAPPASFADFTIGDIVTIEGLYAVNPRTFEALPYLRQFVVTEVNDSRCAFFPARGVGVRDCDVRPFLVGEALGVYTS